MILAIDPGHAESGWCAINPTDCRPVAFGKTCNESILDLLRPHPQGNALHGVTSVVIEMIASYGMPVGAEVFETCVWIGRFCERAEQAFDTVIRVGRQPVKLHHTHSPRAKDSNVIQALVDRFAYGQPNHGKGTKTAPGWFHGFKADVWQAYALAVYTADTRDGRTRR